MRTCKAVGVTVWILHYVYTRANVSGTFWSQICFAVYTQTLNPESKLSGFVMNPETFESGT